MNIAYKIMCNKEVTKDELLYLLWLTLNEHQQTTSDEIVGHCDEKECFNIDDMLDVLSTLLQFDTRTN